VLSTDFLPILRPVCPESRTQTVPCRLYGFKYELYLSQSSCSWQTQTIEAVCVVRPVSLRWPMGVHKPRPRLHPRLYNRAAPPISGQHGDARACGRGVDLSAVGP